MQQIGVLIQKLLDPVYNIQNHRRTEGIFGAAGQQIARTDPVVGDGLLMKRLLMPVWTGRTLTSLASEFTWELPSTATWKLRMKSTS